MFFIEANLELAREMQKGNLCVTPPSESEVETMNTSSCQFIRKALDYSRELIILADEGEASSEDDGCVLLFGVIRDCAYKIRASAEREKQVHTARGLWEPVAVNGADKELR
jgi:hypothetical protein